MIHVVDAAGTEGRDPIADIRAIMKELEAYDPKLLEKPQVIAANKMDAVYGDENEIVQSLRQEFEKDGIRVFPISAVSGKGLKELLYHVQELLDHCDSEPVIYEPEFDPALRFFKDEPYTISQAADGAFEIEGPKIEKCLVIPISILKRIFILPEVYEGTGYFKRIRSPGNRRWRYCAYVWI